MQTYAEPIVERSAPLSGMAGEGAMGRPADDISEWLTFKLGAEEYGIDILRVQEIRSYEVPTRIVNASEALKGVINLRGVIVPIVDLRINFNLPDVSYNDFTVVIILSLGKQVVGVVIDAVSDVITLAPDEIKPAPQLSGGVQSHNLLGIGSLGERTLMLLDIQRLMASEQMGLCTPEMQ